MNLYICSGNSGDRPAMLRYLDGLDAKLRAKVILELAMLARTPFGLLVEPHVKHFSLEKYRELYELRAKGKDMVRIIFTRLPGEKILLIYPFTKKTIARYGEGPGVRKKAPGECPRRPPLYHGTADS